MEAFVSRGLSPLGVRDRSAQGLLWPTGCAQAAAALRPSIAPGRSAHRGGLPTAVPVPVAFQSLSVCPPSHRVPLPSGSAQGLVLACWPPDRGRAGASSTSMRLGGPWGAPGPSAVLVGRPWAGCGFAVDAGRSDSATCPGPGQLDSQSSRPCPFPREGGGRPAFPGAAVLATPQRGAGRRAGRRAHLCPSPHPAAGQQLTSPRENILNTGSPAPQAPRPRQSTLRRSLSPLGDTACRSGGQLPCWGCAGATRPHPGRHSASLGR